MAASVYFFAQFQGKKYTSETVLYAGTTSGYQLVGDNSQSTHDPAVTNNAFTNLLSLIEWHKVWEEVCLRRLAFEQQHAIVGNDQQVLLLTTARHPTADTYSPLEMQYAGATAALASIVRPLHQRGMYTLQSQEIMGLRNRLASFNSQADGLALSAPTATALLACMHQQAAQLTDKIGKKANGYYPNVPVEQRVVVKELLAEYPKLRLRTDDLRSQLDLMRRQTAPAASRRARHGGSFLLHAHFAAHNPPFYSFPV